MDSPFASLDLGTHTARLLIASVESNKLIPLLKKRIITKIGFYFDGSIINETGVNILAKALKEYSQLMQSYQVKGYQAIATAILRQANNREDIIKDIKKRTGIEIKVIDGKTEAILTAKGVFSTLNVNKLNTLIIDIGGGSTEFVYLDKNIFLSLPIGATWLTRQFLKHDPPQAEEIEKTFKLTEERILNLKIPQPQVLVGTAGTISTLAAIDLEMEEYQPQLINGHILSKKRISQIFNKLIMLPINKRCSILGLEPGREEVILGGTIIVLTLLKVFQKDILIVSEGGFLEGILVDYLEQIFKRKNFKFIL